MIKKLVAFVLLLGAGYLALWALVGEESLANIGSATPTLGAEPKSDSAPSGAVSIPVGERSGLTDEVRASLWGGLTVPEYGKQVALPGGGVRKLPVYVLHCADSRPTEQGVQELDDVRVEFFETRGSPPVEAVLSGVLTARHAYVTLGKDERGNPSIAKDKDIELRDAVLATEPDARVGNARMELSRAFVRASEGVIALATRTPDVPFTLEVRDPANPWTLSGRGLRARIPRSTAGAPATEPLLIEVAADPVLVHRGPDGESRLTADGPLTYREDESRGTAEISARRHVRVQSSAALGEAPGRADGAGPFVAFGDRIEATVRRGRTAGDLGFAWQRLLLTGTRSGLEGRGLLLTCETIDVVPNLVGQPWLFTARGRPELHWTDAGREIVFEAADAISVVRLREHWGPWLEGRGWTRTLVHRQLNELLIFRGASSVTLPEEGGTMHLSAERGLRVLRGAGEDAPMTIWGHGRVAVAQSASAGARPLAVRGSDGFLLHVDHRGHTLRLGPKDAGAAHRFELETAEVSAAGSGACRLFRPAAEGAPGRLALHSPQNDIELALHGSGGGLTHVASLEATFDAAGVASLTAEGPACALDWSGREGRLTGTASRIWSRQRGVYHLQSAAEPGTPAERRRPATLTLDRGGRLSGSHLTVVQLAPEKFLVEASGGAHLEADEIAVDGEIRALGLDLRADLITLYPFLVPRLPRVAMPPWVHEQHLIARGDVTVVQRAPAESGGASVAHGSLLVLSLGDAPRGRLTGWPARIERQDAQGQTVCGEAAAVLLSRGDGERLVLEWSPRRAPRLEIRGRQGSLAALGTPRGSTRITCRGPIELDALEIRFAGPVDIDSLDAYGAPEAGGFRLDAGAMRFERDPESGDVVRLHAFDGAELRWRQIDAAAERLTLDIVAHRCSAESDDGIVRIRLPGRGVGEWTRADFDYLTYEGDFGPSVITQDRSAQ